MIANGDRRRYALPRPPLPEMQMRIIILGCIALVSCATLTPAQAHCDVHYRWQQKIDDSRLNQTPVHTTISAMLNWAAPPFTAAEAYWCQPRNMREQRVYEITAWAHRLKAQNSASGDTTRVRGQVNASRNGGSGCVRKRVLRIGTQKGPPSNDRFTGTERHAHMLRVQPSVWIDHVDDRHEVLRIWHCVVHSTHVAAQESRLNL
jgi:hypothetical protein